jgi:hypothetical protein
LGIAVQDANYSRLFKFWQHSGASRDDVQTVVNANALLYLGESSDTEPVIAWLCEVASRGLEENTDKSYRSRPAFYHALSRCFLNGIERFGVVKESLERSLAELSLANGRIGEDELQTALAVSAKLNFRIPVEQCAESIIFILQSQLSDGSWESCPFYYDGRAIPEISWGSRATTTGFCIEALARYASAGGATTS